MTRRTLPKIWIQAWFSDGDKHYPRKWGRVYLLEDGQVQFRNWYRRLWPTDECVDGWRVFECRDNGRTRQVLLQEEDWQRLLKKAERGR